MRTLAEINKNKEYKATMNKYVVKKQDGKEVVEAIPANKHGYCYKDDDFGWKQLINMKNITVHTSLIPSGNITMSYCPMMPDLTIRAVCHPEERLYNYDQNIKIQNSNIIIPKTIAGFKPTYRNKKPFNTENMQTLYNKICQVTKFEFGCFVYPAVRPEFALYGWKEDKDITIWPNEDENKAEEIQKMIDWMKEIGMTNNKKLIGINLSYQVSNRWGHTATILFEFRE